ncbi:hypothetical protein [uncultured Dechloromonas sp.]|uniref:hypothetical protein n=1 Tax=uncultured Dechloromonas sp. TaxID=171719 RepID=UPI0025F5D66B|nr:hypothetical protein [uncultured Dechloromonas sp.]
MSIDAIVASTQSIIANQRRAALALIDAQCGGLGRLGSFPVGVVKAVSREQESQIQSLANRAGETIEVQAESLIRIYGDQARRTVGWAADFAEEQATKLTGKLSIGNVDLDRFIAPGFNVLEKLTDQIARVAGEVARVVEVAPCPVEVIESAARAETSVKPSTRKATAAAAKAE